MSGSLEVGQNRCFSCASGNRTRPASFKSLQFKVSTVAVAKILVVEDEILVALDLLHSLEELGYEPVGAAPDCATALALADRRPDLALVDLNLRDGATGATLAEKIVHRGVTVLFLTANPSLAPELDGAVGVVAKPVDERVLGQVIEFALKRRAGDRNAAAPAGMRLL